MATTIDPLPTTTCIAPWYGSARLIAKHVGAALHGCSWVGVPFAGGMAELLHIEARTMLISDLHWQVINLAETAAHPKLGPELYRRLNRLLFHSLVLASAQIACQSYLDCPPQQIPNLEAAVDYFVAVWMGRSGIAGTDGEFNGNLPIRWNATGGDSAVRYRSAVKSLLAWRKVLQRCSFVVLDAFEFLDCVMDVDGHGIYIDPPWIKDGDGYRHKFSFEDHKRLAKRLLVFNETRVVIRAGDTPMVRELYSGPYWCWRAISGRTQANKPKAEVLISNQPFASESL